MNKAQLQAERAKQTSTPRYDRAFARRQWRNSFSLGTFRYRGKLPSCPSFKDFCETVQ